MNRFCFFILFLAFSGCATTPVERPPATAHPTEISVRTEDGRMLTLDLEDYLVGVLAKEMPASWPLEALKAQAIASRSFALYRKNNPRTATYEMEGSILDQAFIDQEVYPESLRQAVRETEGKTLEYQGAVLPAFFHSACGGISEKADAVWPGITLEPLNQIHGDPFCADSPSSRWDYTFDPPESIRHLKIVGRNENGRVHQIAFSSDNGLENFQGNQFREKWGFQKIKSTLFDVEETQGRIQLTGRGFGHGVGLCQWGAKGMAESGYDYREILEFYYPGAELKTWTPLSSPTTTLPN